MADRFPGEIWIGGELSKTRRLNENDPHDKTTVLQGLISALHEDNACMNYGDAVIPEDETDLSQYINLDGLLNLKSDQATMGEFEETESFCIKFGLPFDRWSDHYCEYDVEHVYYRPGMERPLCVYLDSGGVEMVSGEVVRAALSQLIKFRIQRDESQLETAIGLLERICPNLPYGLRPFKIIS